MRALQMFCCLVLVGPLTAQNITDKVGTIYDDQGVRITYEYVECDMPISFDQESVILTVENQNTFDVVVSWNAILIYDEDCRTCDDPNGEYAYSLSLSAGEKRTGCCGEECTQDLAIFSKFIDEHYAAQAPNNELTKFSLDNLTVTKTSEE